MLEPGDCNRSRNLADRQRTTAKRNPVMDEYERITQGSPRGVSSAEGPDPESQPYESNGYAA